MDGIRVRVIIVEKKGQMKGRKRKKEARKKIQFLLGF